MELRPERTPLLRASFACGEKNPFSGISVGILHLWHGKSEDKQVAGPSYGSRRPVDIHSFVFWIVDVGTPRGARAAAGGGAGGRLIRLINVSTRNRPFLLTLPVVLLSPV